MNNIEQFYDKSVDEKQFTKEYLKYLQILLSKIDVEQVAAFINELEVCLDKRNNIFVAGNGGSASTSSHMVNDMGIGLLKKSKTNKAFRISSLNDSTPLMTAISNDDCYENIFINQLKVHFSPGDLLIAISASGNSPNIIKTAKWVKEHGGKVVGLVGFDGGLLKTLSDIVIQVDTPKSEYGPVEDIHLIINHLVVSWFQCKVSRQ